MNYLPDTHLDRMIVWQAIQRKIVLISKDHYLIGYQKFGLKTFW